MDPNEKTLSTTKYHKYPQNQCQMEEKVLQQVTKSTIKNLKINPQTVIAQKAITGLHLTTRKGYHKAVTVQKNHLSVQNMKTKEQVLPCSIKN